MADNLFDYEEIKKSDIQNNDIYSNELKIVSNFNRLTVYNEFINYGLI